MLLSYDIGTSTIGAAQRAIEVIGQNIANANTQGYHRQDASLVSRVNDPRFGSGVAVANVRRFTSDAVRASIRQSASESNRLDARLQSQSQIENILRAGTEGIDGRIESFFNQVTTLTTRPDDAAQRRVFLAAGSGLAQELRNSTTALETVRFELRGQVQQVVREINDIAPRIAKLNQNINVVEVSGGRANDLRDQRDQLINQLSEKIDIRLSPEVNGVINITAGGAALVTGDLVNEFQVVTTPTTELSIVEAASGKTVVPRGGTLSGFLEEVNVNLPAARGRLDTLARSIISQINAVQATGLGTGGPVTSVAGSFSLPSATATLASQNLPIPAQAGTVAISITNLTSGSRTIANVTIDPATQNIQDIAGAFTAATGGQVTGSVDSNTNGLVLQASSGFAFDFAGRLPSSPTGNTGGTSVPQVTGTFKGESNDILSFNVIGSGTVGTTPGLSIEVRDSASTLINTVNIGEGYVAGNPIDLGNGLTVRLGAGTANAGTFSVQATANPDTANLLPALGVNGFFSGSNAEDIRVRSDLLADPTKLSISRSGIVGDGSNLIRFLAAREAKTLSGNTLSIGAYAADIANVVGSEVNSLQDEVEVQLSLQTNMEADEQALIGVDVNSEMLNLLRFERMVEAGSRYLAVVNRALDSILEIATS
jgi:flagellar hook-associated protein FlgK